MSPSSPSSTLTPPPRQTRLQPLTVWVLEQTLSEQRRHLRLGQELQTEITPAEPSLTRELLHGQPTPHGLAGVLTPSTSPCGSVRAVAGRVQQILAVTTIYRSSADGSWQPVPGAARARPVDSTCQADPTRSVWICSGKPVLTGFLLTLLPPEPSTSR